MSHQISAYYGPGTWYTIHLLAYNSNTDNEKTEFVKMVNLIRDTFPCEKCRSHIVSYLETNPIARYWNIPTGLFRWSWLFHNAVNRRIGKSEYLWDDALAFYSSTDGEIHICDGGCNEISASSSNRVPLRYVSRRELILRPNRIYRAQ